MGSGLDRRQFWRAAFNSPVRLVSHDAVRFGQLLDISLRGALVEVPSDWQTQVGDECLIQLDLSPGNVISMWATVNHCSGSQIGFRCRSMDLDSMTHLRRLVELNAGDPSLLERELTALLTE